MNKSIAMKKCAVLHGSVDSKSERYIQRYTADLLKEANRNKDRIYLLNKRLGLAQTEAKQDAILEMIDNENTRHTSKRQSLERKIGFWKESPEQYEIKLSCLKEERK